METINKQFLTDKLKLFLGNAKAEEVISACIKACALQEKTAYNKEEMKKILNHMIQQKGYTEFIARNALIILEMTK